MLKKSKFFKIYNLWDMLYLIPRCPIFVLELVNSDESHSILAFLLVVWVKVKKIL